MSFLNPVILAGLAAVSLPIIIHLLNKLRVQRSKWAAMRFVQESMRKNRRRIQMEDLLLLIVRCLLVALLVLAFAQPVLKTRVAGGMAASGSVAVAVVLDNSASMGQSNGVETRFEEGQKAIDKAVDALGSGSILSLFLVSDRADALIAKPSPDLTRFRRSLQLAPLSNRSTDLAKGVRAAYESLKSVTDRPREVWIYTDSQAPAWGGLDQIQQLEQQHPDINFKPVVLGHNGEENLAVIDLQSQGGVPAVNQPCNFRVRVANYGSRPATGIRVRLSLDDAAPCDEALLDHIDPGATKSVNLFGRFATTGFHSVSATLPPDRLPVDNQRAAAVQVADKMKVLIMESSSQVPVVERDGYFLANALAPIAADQTAGYYLQVEVASAAILGQKDITPYKVLFLCNPPAISEAQSAALKAYLDQGGNIVIFPGPKSNPGTWPASFAALLPAMVSPVQQVDNLPLQGRNFSHPVTELWNDAAQGNLGAVTFNHYFPLKLKDAPTDGGEKPVAMLQLSSGGPAAAEWARGRGRVVLFDSTATSQWNNLPLHPAFVPLMQRLLGYLSRNNSARLTLAPGETFILPVAMDLLGKDFSVIRPGADKTKRPGGSVELQDQHAVVRYRDTDELGAYRVFVENKETPEAVFAVQMDPKESDLRQEAAGDVAGLQRPAETSIKTGEAMMEVSREYWTSLMWAGIVLALIELALAHYFSRAK